MTLAHDHFTLLYEDGETKVLHEFKALIADDVLQRLVDFLKGCGYMEGSIFEAMKEASELYFDAMSVEKYVLNSSFPLQQEDLGLE
jgi:hypothetical protein